MIMSWQDVTRSSLCSGVKECGKNVHTVFSFPNPLSESEELQSWGCPKFLLSFLMRLDGHFFTTSATAAMFTSFRVDFGRPTLSSSTSSLPSRNREYRPKSLIGPEPHSHKLFAPILVFLSQIDRLWNKILWQLSVHFQTCRGVRLTPHPF